MFYIQRNKWSEKRVVITHIGPFNSKEGAVDKMKRMRYNKSVDISIIEKTQNET